MPRVVALYGYPLKGFTAMMVSTHSDDRREFARSRKHRLKRREWMNGSTGNHVCAVCWAIRWLLVSRAPKTTSHFSRPRFPV